MLFVLAGLTIAITSFFSLIIGNQAFAVEYTNYTSEKYKIQFQYPSDWSSIEKTEPSGDTYLVIGPNVGRLSVYYYDAMVKFGTLNVEATKNFVSTELREQLRIEVREIEKPTFITIDGQKAGTMVFGVIEKYKSDPAKFGVQWWIVVVGTNGYRFSFVDSASNFDSLENIEIRDHFIKSIKFIESSNLEQNIEPQKKSRFD